ncbi:MAG: TMEM165/GDT1 family protein [Synechococcaceae cyanobacterium]
MNSEESGQSPAGSGPQTPEPTPATGAFLAALATTFTTVFLAELGDKTQLAALLLSAQSGQPLVVFIGASLALISSSLVGVLLGRWLARLLPAHELERLAGLLMVGLSLWLGRQAVVQLNAPPIDLPLG